MELITLEEPWQWITAELAQTEIVPGSRFHKDKNTISLREAVAKSETASFPICKQEFQTSNEATVRQPTNPPTNPSGLSDSSLKGAYTQTPEQWPSRSPYPVPTPYTPQLRSGTYDPYSSLPPVPVPNEQLDPSIMLQFTKTYDREKKYTGNAYDLLDDKLKIFFNICFHTRITPGQFYAVFPRILTGRAEQYYLHYVNREDDFYTAYTKIKNHFDTEVNHNHYFTDWTTTTFMKIRQENPEKGLQDVLQILLDKLQLCQRALGPEYAGEGNLRTTVIKACRGVPELEHALFKPARLCEELFSDLRSSIETALSRTTSLSSQRFLADQEDVDDQFYLDRRYSNNHSNQRKFPSRNLGQNERPWYRQLSSKPGGRQWRRKCFICHKEGCWSTKHSEDERRRARKQYLAHCEFTGDSTDGFATYLADYEGHVMDFHLVQDNESLEGKEYSEQAIQYLTDQAFVHHLTGIDTFNLSENTTPADQFLIEDRYSRTCFQGILIDIGAARVSTAGFEQLQALQNEHKDITLDTSTKGQASVKFGKGSVTVSMGSVNLDTPIGQIQFHVLNASTPFLLCLADMDRLNVYFNNTANQLVQNGRTIPV
ncbi:hypothetical protein K3495_g15064, partial [Podosphaera aphanis]